MASGSYAGWLLRWVVKMTNMLHRFTPSVLGRWYLNTWKEKTILSGAYFIGARPSAGPSRLFSEKAIRARWHDLSRMEGVWSGAMEGVWSGVMKGARSGAMEGVWSGVMKRARSGVMESARTMLNGYYAEWLFDAPGT